MTHKKLLDLASVTSAVFETEFLKLRPILEEEARIHNQISDLNAQMSQVRSDAIDADGYRIAGADILWHSWESSTRRQLNVKLARVKSRKLAMMDDLRAAFGRKQAVESLCRDHASKQQRARQKKQLDQSRQ